MIKTWSKLNDREKEIVHKGIFYILICFILLTSINAYRVYDEFGLQACIIETDKFTGVNETICFDTYKERNKYLESKTYPNFLDYKFINNYTNISFVEFNQQDG